MSTTDQKPTFLEFFAGGGMVSQALGASWDCLFANDFSAKKGAAYVENWGDSHFLLEDVRAVTSAHIPGLPDLAWGSSPCQDVSLAGVGKGLSGCRSSMFWPYFNIIRNLKREGRCPKIVVLENVAGLVTSNGGADFAAVCEAFHGEGFRFGGLIADAIHWVPQSRPRFFLVAVAEDIEIPSSAQREGPNPTWHTAALGRAFKALPESIKSDWIWWTLGPAPTRNTVFADIIEDNPGDVRWRTRSETKHLLSMMTPLHMNRIKAIAAKTKLSGRREIGGLYRRTRAGVQRAEVRFDGVAGCLRTPNGGSSRQSIVCIEKGKVRTRLLSKREAARLMGLPDEYKLPENYNDAYHLAGDGVAVPVVAALAERIFEPILNHDRISRSAAA